MPCALRSTRGSLSSALLHVPWAPEIPLVSAHSFVKCELRVGVSEVENFASFT